MLILLMTKVVSTALCKIRYNCGSRGSNVAGLVMDLSCLMEAGLCTPIGEVRLKGFRT